MNCFKQFVAGTLLAATALGGSASTFVGDRSDFRDETIYFAMTTRFYDGDPKNNVLCWDGVENQIQNNDPAWRGDFKGLIEKLDYIKALGFTAIWITPVVQNASGFDYHGYHAMDFSKVDLRYESRKTWGADEDVTFKSLIDAAHEKGIKIILDIVLQHTGNFGEDYLCHLFDRDQNIRNQAKIEACLIPDDEKLGGASYWDLPNDGPTTQYSERFKYMKNTRGQNFDTKNYWHHVSTSWNWDEPSRWWGQIAGDCVDLNTENPAVDEYIVKCYGEFIKLGVDGFRIDTTGHIAPLTFNSYFIPKFIELGETYKNARKIKGESSIAPFYMFGECCARYGQVIYRDHHELSSHYYTWKSDPALVEEWNSYTADWWSQQVVPEGASPLGNMLTCEKDPATVHNSDNVFMKNGAWHEPDYSEASGFNVIDFPMHYNFNSAGQAVNIAKEGDKFYNDASWNVVYVDSHDYCPGPNDGTRFSGGTEQWAENLSLMFSFRGIPCIYYGSEVEFQKGKTIDEGPKLALINSGRAYFGEYLKGKVVASDFGKYEADGNVAKTLNADLAQHIRRLNQIRAAVPALRKGQYTWDGCSANGGWAFKRAWKDSYALVAINGGATFSNVPAGTYTDIVTGKTYQGGGSITVSAPTNKGQLRVLVKDWTGENKQIGEHGKFIYDTAPVSHGGSVKFTDPGTTEYFTRDDAIDPAGMTFSPAGGSFKTETLDVTIALNESAKSGWFKVGNNAQQNLNAGQQKTVTIGGDMNYGETVTITWGVTGDDGSNREGSVTYKKVDPNAVITLYVTAPSAPHAYLWGESNGKKVEPNGTWPGAKLSESTEINGKTFWSFTTELESVNVIFTMDNGAGKTPDITGITETAFFEYDGNGNAKKIENIDDPTPVVKKPSVAFSPNGGSFEDRVNVTVTAKNATSATYTIGNGTTKTFSSKAQFTLGDDMEPGTSVTVKWTATNGTDTANGEVTFTKKAPRPIGEGLKIYIKANQAPHLHTWSDDGDTGTGSWPGYLMTDKETEGNVEYWVYTFPKEIKSYKMVLNMGSDAHKTGDLGPFTHDIYYEYDNDKTAKVISTGSNDPVDGDIVYFQNSDNWNSVFAYTWSGSHQQLGAWPGTQMTETTVLNGINYFFIKVPNSDADTKIIFNSGNGTQTGDFDFHPGGYYNALGWTSVDRIDADEIETEYYSLQGVRVMNPSKGIYIVRRGNRTSKVFLQ